MKVLLEDGFSIEKGTGVGRYTQNLAVELGKLPEVELLIPPPGGLVSRIRPIGARRILYSAWLETRFQSQLAKLGPDIVHFTNYLIPRTRKSKAKYVATIHDLTAWRLPDALPAMYARYIRSAITRLVKVADLILCPSHSVRREVMEHFNLSAEKVRTTWNGTSALPVISPERQCALRNGFRERLGVQKPFLLFVGTLERRKNVPTMIEAFARVADKYDLRLVIVGRPGFGFSEIRRAIQRQACRDRYILTGFLSDEELAVLYKLADLFVYPSFYEGFGIPLIEAMENGLPIAASNIPSTKEVAGEAASYYGDPLDASALAGKIAEVLDRPSLKETLALQGKSRAADFTYDRVIHQYLDAYRAVMKTI